MSDTGILLNVFLKVCLLALCVCIAVAYASRRQPYSERIKPGENGQILRGNYGGVLLEQSRHR